MDGKGGSELSVLTFNLSKEEEAELELCVMQGYEWSALPADTKRCLGYSPDTWAQFVMKYSIQHQLNWRTGLVSKMLPDERAYFDSVIKYSQEKLMVYPYHLQHVLAKAFRLTPFKYYLTMMFTVMKSERSYDSLPNFTATDGVRLLGIGRNQFIDTMNSLRAKSWLSRKRKGTLYELLPKVPVEIPVQHWWEVRLGFVTDDDVKASSKLEHSTIDFIIEKSVRRAGELHRDAIQSLYRRGLIYIDVPIYDNDLIIVPPLRGFVMNRVLGDYFETLLYKIFVSIDERTTIKQLANVLQIDISDVKQAVSLYIRLGFAYKKNIEPLTSVPALGSSTKRRPRWHSSCGVDDSPGEGGAPVDSSKPAPYMKRTGFIFDSSITAYLMMGNLAPGLKTHAVTMFEVGKLPDESLDDFLLELAQVNPVGEGEAQTYIDHAICLKNTLNFLRRKEHCRTADSDGGVDLLRCERLNSLDEPTRLRVLDKNYSLLVSMAPIYSDSLSGTRIIPRHFGPALPEVSFVWFQLYTYELMGWGTPTVMFPRGCRVSTLPHLLRQFAKVRFSSWGTEAYIVTVANLLPTLNDALLSSPVCLQAFSHGEEPMQVQVAFPLDLLSEDKLASYRSEITVKNMQYHPALQQLARKIPLLQHSFGYISMINPNVHMPSRKSTWAFAGTPSMPTSSEDLDNQEYFTRTYNPCHWFPLQIHFGIPLFSPTINAQVCDGIVRHRLFSSENLATHHNQSRLMCNEVFDFIERLQRLEHKFEVEAGFSPYPTEVVVFSGSGSVHVANERCV